MTVQGNILALCGGVGGAKLAFGLAETLPPDRLTIVVNTGDDFEHCGLPISPDLDTVLYTLGGLANRTLGWGREQENWTAFEELKRLGGPDWFQLGDRDIATHLTRRHMLDDGATLSEAITHLANRFRIKNRISPMSDDRVRTIVTTDQGPMPFQEYFVANRCEPKLESIAFAGADDATPAPAFASALADPDLSTVILCPSNPFLSIDPILAIPGIRTGLAGLDIPVIAVSPLIGGKAVKGPTAKICDELGVPATADGMAGYYTDFLTGFVLDQQDHELAADWPHDQAITVTNTLMSSDVDKIRLARETLNFAANCTEGTI